MNSFLKGILHTVATAASFWLPSAISQSPVFNESLITVITHFAPFLTLSVGVVIAIVLNWVISHTIPTTTGASVTQ